MPGQISTLHPRSMVQRARLRQGDSCIAKGSRMRVAVTAIDPVKLFVREESLVEVSSRTLTFKSARTLKGTVLSLGTE